MTVDGDGDGDGGPYRTAAGSPLGEVRERFVVARRARYLGSANAVARTRPLSPGALVYPSAGRAAALPEGRRSPTDVIELCARGLRLRSRAGTLELTFDQLTVERITGPAGLVALVITGAHGERLTLDRSLRHLDRLDHLLRNAAPPDSPVIPKG